MDHYTAILESWGFDKDTATQRAPGVKLQVDNILKHVVNQCKEQVLQELKRLLLDKLESVQLLHEKTDEEALEMNRAVKQPLADLTTRVASNITDTQTRLENLEQALEQLKITQHLQDGNAQYLAIQCQNMQMRITSFETGVLDIYKNRVKSFVRDELTKVTQETAWLRARSAELAIECGHLEKQIDSKALMLQKEFDARFAKRPTCGVARGLELRIERLEALVPEPIAPPAFV